MYIADKIVFMELPKTGTTHIRKLLAETLPGEQIGEHNRVTPELLASDRKFLGSIRDPWDWYVSEWAFGCAKRGGVYRASKEVGWRFHGRGWRTRPLHALQQYLSDKIHRQDWVEVYDNPHDPERFRKWLRMMYNPRFYHAFGEHFDKTRLSAFAGLYTCRYLRMFSRDASHERVNPIATYQQMVDFIADNCFIDHFIHMENLEHELIAALEASGIELTEAQRTHILTSGKSNVTQRHRDLSVYYDDESRQLVAERERYIIDKFGYRFNQSAEVPAAAVAAGT